MKLAHMRTKKNKRNKSEHKTSKTKVKDHKKMLIITTKQIFWMVGVLLALQECSELKNVNINNTLKYIDFNVIIFQTIIGTWNSTCNQIKIKSR